MTKRTPMGLISAIAAIAGTACIAQAEPLQVFGGELAIGDNAAGLSLDINLDGLFDLNFAYYGISVNSIFGWDGVVYGGQSSVQVRFGGGLDENDRVVHTRFAEGEEIGPAIDGGFSFGAVAYETFFDGTSGGAWLDQNPGYVGFSFLSNDTGGRHYGWAEVAIDNDENYEEGFLVLYRIAYETVAGVPIAAGDDGSDPGCNAADLAEPFGLLDLADVVAFVTAFSAMDDAADLDGNGLWDLADVTAFIGAFTAGCP